MLGFDIGPEWVNNIFAGSGVCGAGKLLIGRLLSGQITNWPAPEWAKCWTGRPFDIGPEWVNNIFAGSAGICGALKVRNNHNNTIDERE
jgi:hypothetical protein